MSNTTNQAKNAWPPAELENYINLLLDDHTTISKKDNEALKRLLYPKDSSIELAYTKLSSQFSSETLNQYLIQLCEVFLDLDMYHLTKEVDCRDWYKNIHNNLTRLLKTLSHPPSGELLQPEWLYNLDTIFISTLQDYGDEIAEEQFKNLIDLRNTLKKIPISMVLDTLARHAKEEVYKPHTQLMETDLGISAPKKYGENGSKARKLMLAKAFKSLTLKTFNSQKDEFVTSILNVLLLPETVTTDAINKLKI